jgi:hypothetical protein
VRLRVRDLQIVSDFESTGNTAGADVGDVLVCLIVYGSFESHIPVSDNDPSPGDRARFYYVLAKLYAKSGVTDRSLQYLRRALEEGYKGIDDVYKDSEFAGLRKDPRFTELMAARPVAIPE